MHYAKECTEMGAKITALIRKSAEYGRVRLRLNRTSRKTNKQYYQILALKKTVRVLTKRINRMTDEFYSVGMKRMKDRENTLRARLTKYMNWVFQHEYAHRGRDDRMSDYIIRMNKIKNINFDLVINRIKSINRMFGKMPRTRGMKKRPVFLTRPQIMKLNRLVKTDYPVGPG